MWNIDLTTNQYKDSFKKNKADFLDTIVPEERAMYKYDYEHGIPIKHYGLNLGVATIIDRATGKGRKRDTVTDIWLSTRHVYSGKGVGMDLFNLNIRFSEGNPIVVELGTSSQRIALIKSRYLWSLLNLGLGYKQKYRRDYLADSFMNYEIPGIENDMIRGIQTDSFYQIFNAHKGIWASAKENPCSNINFATWYIHPYGPDFLVRLQGLLLQHAEEAEAYTKGDDKYLVQLYRPHITNIAYISEAIEWNYGWHFNYDKRGMLKPIQYKEFDRMLKCFGLFDQWTEYLKRFKVDCAKLAYIQSALGRYFSIMWEFENEYILDEKTKLEIIRNSRKKKILGKTITKPKDWALIRPGGDFLETKLGKLIQKYIIVAKTCTENQDALQKLDRLEQFFNDKNWFTLCPHRPYVDIYDRLKDKWVQVCRIMDQIGMFDDFLKYICKDGTDPSKAEGVIRTIIDRRYIEARLFPSM